MYKIGLTKGIVMCRLMNLRSLSIMGPNSFQIKLCWKLKVEESLPFGPTGAAKFLQNYHGPDWILKKTKNIYLYLNAN